MATIPVDPMIANVIIAEMANHAENQPWPSLEWAGWIFDRASFVLIGSLVAGAMATVAIVWMGIVKEHHWDLLREQANDQIGHLFKDGEQLKKDAEQLRKETAQANAKAAEAQLALAKFRSPRSLTKEQQDKLTADMKPFAGTPITFGVFQDPEAAALLEQLSSALIAAGWVEQEWKSGGDIVWTRSSPHPQAGFVYVTGMYVQADGPRHSFDFGPVVVKLAKLLSDFGIEAKPEVGRMAENTNNDAIKILIGQKPR